MAKFYFTYGSEGHPFVGGWTEVTADTRRAACEAFRAFHPDKEEGFLNCSSVYTEDEFKSTKMSGPAGNFGYYCHESIVITRELKDGSVPNG